MDVSLLAGRKLSDFITKNTQIVKVNDSTAENINDGKLIIPDKFGRYVYGDDIIINDYKNELVIHLKNNEAIAIFEIYELRNVIFNKGRGLILAVGNGQLHQYWLDNNEYYAEVW